MLKSGILLIDKPPDLTSHDVVDAVRSKLNTRRVGHAGTLDPLATGLLIILVGGATKRFNHFMNLDKEYLATLKLGVATDSGDSHGRPVETLSYEGVTSEQVCKVLEGLKGKIENIPPMVSAIRYKGKRLYKLARKGIIIKLPARIVEIHRLELLGFKLPDIELRVKCSKGTYVRSLAEEIARRLNCVGHISQIRRSSIGPYTVSDAKLLGDFDENDIRAC